MGIFFKSKKDKLEEEQLEKYYKVLDEEEKKFEEDNKITLKDLFKDDEDEKDITQYMNEEEKEEYIKEKKDIKKFTIISLSVISSFVVVLGIISFVFIYMSKDDLHKIYKDEILKHYYDNYGEKTSISDSDINYICYEVQDDETRKKSEECTNIIKAKDKNNNYLMMLKDTNNYADNISIKTYYDDYNNYMRINNQSMQIIWSNPLISDIDWYYKYNQFEEYMRVLPDNNTFVSLLDSNKLTIRDVIMYQGTFNLDFMKEFINKLSDDSKIILIETANATPINLKIITKEGLAQVNIVNQINLDDNIINYQLDTNINLINSVIVNKRQAESVETLDETYNFINAYNINVTKTRINSNVDQSDKTAYYLLAFNSSIKSSNLKEYTNGKELNIDDYKELYTLEVGDITYVIGTDDIGIGNITYKSKGILK